jgi:hypothetical protein
MEDDHVNSMKLVVNRCNLLNLIGQYDVLLLVLETSYLMGYYQ